MRRLLAAALVFACLPVAAEEPVAFIATAPAPEKSAVVVWKFQGVETPGVFLADQQARGMAAELHVCRATHIDASGTAASWWVWAVAGAVVGIAAGAYAHAHLSK